VCGGARLKWSESPTALIDGLAGIPHEKIREEQVFEIGVKFKPGEGEGRVVMNRSSEK
jgi:hypothetical protein